MFLFFVLGNYGSPNLRAYKPPRRSAPCQLDFDTPSFPAPAFLPPLSPRLVYMPIICPYSCTISSYTGFATRDDAYDVMLGIHHTAELQLCFLQSPTAADDDDFLDFSHDDVFFSSKFSFSNITTMIALCMIYTSTDSIMTSPLLCDTADLSVSWVESLCDLSLLVVQSQAVEGHDTWQHAVLDADRAALDRHDAAKTKGYKQFWTFRGAVRGDAHRRRIYV